MSDVPDSAEIDSPGKWNAEKSQDYFNNLMKVNIETLSYNAFEMSVEELTNKIRDAKETFLVKKPTKRYKKRSN